MTRSRVEMIDGDLKSVLGTFPSTDQLSPMTSTSRNQPIAREEPRESAVGNQLVLRPLVSVAQLIEAHPCRTAGAVRAEIFGASARLSSKGVIPGNGLAPAIIRKGRRVLLDEIGYLTWVRTGRVDPYLQSGESTSEITGAPK